jgi:hypothetical protein
MVPEDEKIPEPSLTKIALIPYFPLFAPTFLFILLAAKRPKKY